MLLLNNSMQHENSKQLFLELQGFNHKKCCFYHYDLHMLQSGILFPCRNVLANKSIFGGNGTKQDLTTLN
jgi:hypothetical protein